MGMHTHLDPLAILGGAGPMVCARFQSELLTRFQKRSGAWLDHDFPTVVSLNRAIDGVGPGGLENVEKASQDLATLGACAQAAGAAFALIPCASVHPALPDSFPLPVVDWIGHTAQRLACQGPSVGVLGSRSSRRQGVFREALLALGATVVDLDDPHQALADAIIEEAMAGRASPHTQSSLQACEKFLRDRGAAVVWWGCTEFSFVPLEWALGPVLDPMDAMTTPVLNHWLGELP